MPDSNITKRALAAALKELMETQPFARISVGDICQACDMSRKSFYYHFKDKYDLVNWIYYTECLTALREIDYQNPWSLLNDLCQYFYENRGFYRKTFTIEGQNSFSEYFRDITALIVGTRLSTSLGRKRTPVFMWTFIPMRSSPPSSAGCCERTAFPPGNSLLKSESASLGYPKTSSRTMAWRSEPSAEKPSDGRNGWLFYVGASASRTCKISSKG